MVSVVKNSLTRSSKPTRARRRRRRKPTQGERFRDMRRRWLEIDRQLGEMVQAELERERGRDAS